MLYCHVEIWSFVCPHHTRLFDWNCLILLLYPVLIILQVHWNHWLVYLVDQPMPMLFVVALSLLPNECVCVCPFYFLSQNKNFSSEHWEQTEKKWRWLSQKKQNQRFISFLFTSCFSLFFFLLDPKLTSYVWYYPYIYINLFPINFISISF